MFVRQTILTILTVFHTMLVLGQGGANHWVFGDSVWLEFTDTGVIQRRGIISTREASSSINEVGSDSLMFYSTPNTVFDISGNPVVEGLYGHHSASQGAIFLRHPDSDSIIHLFTSEDIDPKFLTGLYHHIIKTSGEVILKNDTLLYGKTEQLTAVNHQNNRSIWIASHLANTDSFYLYLLANDGLIDCPIIYNSGNPYNSFWAEGSILKFSSDGQFLAGSMLFANKLEFYRFNNETGLISDQVIVPNVLSPFGIEFAPNSHLFYVSSSAMNSLIQFDLSSFTGQDIDASRRYLASLNQAIGHLQLALNGRIYAANNDSNFLGVINNPELKGSGCNYVENGLELVYGRSRKGLPGFNQSFFFQPSLDLSYQENCSSLTYNFFAIDTFQATDFKWTFFNQDLSINDSSYGRSSSYRFGGPGLWKVTLVASNGQKVDSVSKFISVQPAWEEDFLGDDTFFCEGEIIHKVLHSPPDMHCVHWMGSAAYGQPDSFLVEKEGTYYVKVTNKSFCTTFDTITFTTVEKPPVPSITRLGDSLYCDTDSVTYHWYFNDYLLESDSMKSIAVKKNGIYRVVVTNIYGCSSTSDTIQVKNIGVVDLEEYGVVLFPNPVKDILTIRLNQPERQLEGVQVFSLAGYIVYASPVSTNNATIDLDLSGIEAGSYFLELSFKQSVIHCTIVID